MRQIYYSGALAFFGSLVSVPTPAIALASTSDSSFIFIQRGRLMPGIYEFLLSWCSRSMRFWEIDIYYIMVTDVQTIKRGLDEEIIIVVRGSNLPGLGR